MGFFSRFSRQHSGSASAGLSTEETDTDPQTATGKPGVLSEEASAKEPDDQMTSPSLSAAKGPFSAVEDANEDSFFDLGVIQLPMIEGVQVVPMIDENGTFHAVEVIAQDVGMQLTAYAMQRSGGLWEDEILPQLTEDMDHGDYDLFPLPGEYGEAILARPKPSSEAEQQGAMSMLVWGIEGDRWLLRVIFRGAAAEDDEQRKPLLEILYRMVVIRGKQAYLPGDLLPLSLPEELLKQLQEYNQQLVTKNSQDEEK